jgi:hypothetical protein
MGGGDTLIQRAWTMSAAHQWISDRAGGLMMDEEVREAFASVFQKLDSVIDMKATLTNLANAFNRHVEEDRTFLLGRDNTSEGLIVKVDRLERSWANYQRMFYILASTVIGLLGAALWEVIKSHLH